MATVTKNRTYGKIVGNNSKTVNNIKNLTCVAYNNHQSFSMVISEKDVTWFCHFSGQR
jgi:hypothetical protein